MHTNHVCIFGNTGSGKSLYFFHLAKNLQKIIFLCKSYQQAHEKAKSFEELGFSVQIVKSKNEKLKSEEIEVSYLKKKNPFSLQISNLTSLSKEEKEIYSSIEKDEFDLNGPQIIITVFQNTYSLKGQDLSDWHVVFDDIEYTDIRPLIKFEPKEWTSQPVLEWAKINGRDISFAQRPEELFCTYNLLAKNVYFTTADLHIKKILEAKYFCESIDLSHEEENHSITILSTSMTRKKKQDALISLFHRLQVQNGTDWVLIGDGIGSEISFSSMKGVNSLSDKNILIELSIENQVVLEEMYCMLAPNKMTTDKTKFKLFFDQLSRIIMIDKFHQSVGRNQGNRFSNKTTLVLIDKYFASSISKMTNYKDVPLLKDVDFKSRAMIISHFGKIDYLVELSKFMYDKSSYFLANEDKFKKLFSNLRSERTNLFKQQMSKLFDEQISLSGQVDNIHYKQAVCISSLAELMKN